MPKVGMEPFRRAEAINATLECICEHGIDQITLEMVAAKAGFSKGIVAYYFKNKKQLIFEAMKAFLSSYRLKIQSSITENMSPLQMVKTVAEQALPPIDDGDSSGINVSTIDGADKIYLPEKLIANLFTQLIARTPNDPELKNLLRETFAEDIKGISLLMRYAKKSCGVELDENKAAYSLFAVIYGLSFFRVAGYMLPGESDNRQIAFDFIETMFR